MRKEQIVTSAVMCIVSILVIIGFTVAWYTVGDAAGVSGIALHTAQQGDIKIALEAGGRDIADLMADSTLEDDKKYVAIGLEELSNIGFKEIDTNGVEQIVYKIAPGTYGSVTFYVTPLAENVSSCSLTAETILKDSMGDAGTPFTKDNGEITLQDGTMVNVYELAQEHIVFYYYEDADTGLTNPILLDAEADGSDASRAQKAVYPLTWDSVAGSGIEREVTLYWKWYYENPEFESRLAEETEGLDAATAAAKERILRQDYREQINEYDKEDTLIGNYIKSMQMHFSFTAP